MADLHILIKSSEITGTLRGYATQETQATYLVVPAADASDAITELESIGDDESIYSSNVTEGSGSVNGILLPKHVVEG